MPTRHPDPQSALRNALDDYTQAVAEAITAHTARLGREQSRLVARVASITQTYEADRETLAAIREMTHDA